MNHNGAKALGFGACGLGLGAEEGRTESTWSTESTEPNLTHRTQDVRESQEHTKGAKDAQKR